jgi:hypothetical protein
MSEPGPAYHAALRMPMLARSRAADRTQDCGAARLRQNIFAANAKTIDRDAHSIMFDRVSVTRAAWSYIKPRETKEISA